MSHPRTAQDFATSRLTCTVCVGWYDYTIPCVLAILNMESQHMDLIMNAMIDELAQKDIKTVLITEPFVLTSSNRWQEAVDGNVLGINAEGNPLTYDFYFGNTGLIDVFAPQAKSWFWNIYKSYTEMGVAGWWGDLGEPEVHPEAMIHSGGRTANEVHNIFGNEWEE